MPYQRVLLATDTSEASAQAARLALKLASPDGAVRLVSVVAFPDPPGYLPVRIREEVLAASAARREETREVVAEWARRAGVPKPSVAIREGHVGREIAREAVDFGADLVALGARGAGRVERLLVGSTARSVLHHVSTDVLVSRAEGPKPAVRKVLVATDFHGPSRAAGRRAAAIAKETGAELIAYHALDPGLWAGVLRDGAADGRPGLDREWLEKSMADALHAYNAETLGGAAKEVLDSGRPALAACDYARENGVDLAVVGTHGFGPVARALLGSVATTIVEKASCSVVVVKP